MDAKREMPQPQPFHRVTSHTRTSHSHTTCNITTSSHQNITHHVTMYDVTHHPSFIGQSVTSHTPQLVQSDFLSKVSFASNKNTRGLFLVQSELEGPHFRAVENHVILCSRQKTRFGGFGAAKEKGDHKIGPPLLSFAFSQEYQSETAAVPPRTRFNSRVWWYLYPRSAAIYAPAPG